MIHGNENLQVKPSLPRTPRVSYRMTDVNEVLAEPGTLAVFGFGTNAPCVDDPRYMQIALEPFDAPAALEAWQVDGPTVSGQHGPLRWTSGGGWLSAMIELDEHAVGGIENATRDAYAALRRFLLARPERHVLRMWNYIAQINQGKGDAERYKQFCDGRAAGLGDFFAAGYPAATAIGHHGKPVLQVYLLASTHAGAAVENPRQISAWRYPRQYGRTSPGFARAMLMPAHDALAISGTAAIVGHTSEHDGDLEAQLSEILVNLEALLSSSHMPPGFDTHSPLKTYVRHSSDVERVRVVLQQRLPGVPVMVMHGDVCRSELLVEIDGWRFI